MPNRSFILKSIAMFASSLAIESVVLSAEPLNPIQPDNCRTSKSQVLELKNLLNAVCVEEGEAGHICGDQPNVEIKSVKDGKTLSTRNIETPLSNALRSVVTRKTNEDSQIRTITKDAEIQSFDSQTNELKTIKIANVLEKLAKEKKLPAPMREFMNAAHSDKEMAEFASKLKFSDDGRYLVLPKDDQSENRISLSDIFDSKTSADLKPTPVDHRVVENMQAKNIEDVIPDNSEDPTKKEKEGMNYIRNLPASKTLSPSKTPASIFDTARSFLNPFRAPASSGFVGTGISYAQSLYESLRANISGYLQATLFADSQISPSITNLSSDVSSSSGPQLTIENAVSSTTDSKFLGDANRSASMMNLGPQKLADEMLLRLTSPDSAVRMQTQAEGLETSEEKLARDEDLRARADTLLNKMPIKLPNLLVRRSTKQASNRATLSSKNFPQTISVEPLKTGASTRSSVRGKASQNTSKSQKSIPVSTESLLFFYEARRRSKFE